MATHNLTSFLVAMAISGTAAAVLAEGMSQPKGAGEGTLMLQDKDYPLTQALAYETAVDGEKRIVVVLTSRAITSEQLKAAREGEEDGGGGHEFKRPFLRLEFGKTGELKLWSAAAGITSLGQRSGEAKGELAEQNGRVIGKASQPNSKETMFSSGFDVRFDVALLKVGESLPATVVEKPGPAANVKPTVTGTFIGNGKEANLAYVSARWREPFGDQASIMLIFSEKDHSKDKKPDFDASFGKFGSALIISLHEDGSIFGCQIVHSAHSKKGFSSVGNINTNDFKYAGGKVEGELATEGEPEFFGDTWKIDLKFVAPLGEIPKEFQPAAAKEPEKRAKETPAPEKSEAKAAAPPADQLNVKDLALPKDASDFEYKALVEHLAFKSKSSVKAVCSELTATLKAQGWANEGRDLLTPNSSILRRKRGEATLTIFVKPEAGGSEVKMFTKGLSWADGQ